jgi:hypothetical protein
MNIRTRKQCIYLGIARWVECQSGGNKYLSADGEQRLSTLSRDGRSDPQTMRQISRTVVSTSRHLARMTHFVTTCTAGNAVEEAAVI